MRAVNLICKRKFGDVLMSFVRLFRWRNRDQKGLVNGSSCLNQADSRLWRLLSLGT
jgi:hypothetical protein